MILAQRRKETMKHQNTLATEGAEFTEEKNSANDCACAGEGANSLLNRPWATSLFIEILINFFVFLCALCALCGKYLDFYLCAFAREIPAHMDGNQIFSSSYVVSDLYSFNDIFNGSLIHYE